MGSAARGFRAVLDGRVRADQKNILDDIRPPSDVDVGAWTFTFTTDFVGATGFAVTAALARIWYGVGGQLLFADISLLPEVAITVPSTSVRVDVLWDPDLAAVYALPTSCTIRGIAQLGMSAGGNNTARLVKWQPLTLAGHSITVPVPRFAIDWMVTGNPSTDPLFSSDFAYAWGPGNAPIYSGLEVERALYNGKRLKVPAGATFITPQALADFTLDASGNVVIPDPWALDWTVRL